MNLFHLHFFFLSNTSLKVTKKTRGWWSRKFWQCPNMSRFLLLSGFPNPLPSNLQNITTLKLLKLESWNCQSQDLPIPNSLTKKNLERLYNCVVGCLVVWSVFCNAGLTAREDQTRLDQTKLTKTEMSQKLKCYKNWNVPKTGISPQLKGLGYTERPWIFFE